MVDFTGFGLAFKTYSEAFLFVGFKEYTHRGLLVAVGRLTSLLHHLYWYSDDACHLAIKKGRQSENITKPFFNSITYHFSDGCADHVNQRVYARGYQRQREMLETFVS